MPRRPRLTRRSDSDVHRHGAANAEHQFTNIWTQTYTVTVQPDSSFSGTGEITGSDANGPYDQQDPGTIGADENIVGKFSETNPVSYVSTRSDDLHYVVTDAPTDGTLFLDAKARGRFAVVVRDQGDGTGVHPHRAREEPRPVRQGDGRRQGSSAGLRWDADQLRPGQEVTTLGRAGFGWPRTTDCPASCRAVAVYRCVDWRGTTCKS